MSGYIGTQPVPQATQTRDSFTATASQTSFATSGYTPNFLDVYLNGVKLINGTDFTATNGSDVVLTTGAALNDVLEVVAYSTFESANVTGAVDFTATGTITANQFVGGNINAPKNLIINGGFDVWQRATSQTTSGYGSDDRWHNANAGSTKTVTQTAFALGQTDVAGNPKYYSRTVVTSVAGAGNFAAKLQNMEDVTKTAGKTVTLTFWAKADASKDIAVELYQYFGTGGSPSSDVFVTPQTVTLTASWVKHSLTFAVPSVSGKTLGTDGNDYLSINLFFEAGSALDARTNSLGQQSGTFDIARISLCEGDVTALDDPFEERTYGEELALCQRYYEKSGLAAVAYSSSGAALQRGGVYFITTKRGVPTVAITQTGGAATGGSAVRVFALLNGFTLGFSSTAAGQEWVGEFTADAEL